MTVKDEPYFLSNPDWYYYDKKSFKYKLTSKATPEAVKSYKTFYKLLDYATIKEDKED